MSRLQTLIKTCDILAEQNTKLNPVLDCELFFNNLSNIAGLRIQIDQEIKAMVDSLADCTFEASEHSNEKLVGNCLAICRQDRKKAKEYYIKMTSGTISVFGDGVQAWMPLPNGEKGILPVPIEVDKIKPHARKLLAKLWDETLKTLYK